MQTTNQHQTDKTMNIRVGIMTAPHIEYELRGNTFLLKNVRIGIGFHWDRTEDQLFEGQLEIRQNEDGTETAINVIDVEDYLSSVIASEMSATSSLELLKAHAVISRSWVLRPILNKMQNTGTHPIAEGNKPHKDGIERHIVWYERDAHIGFDVCADDHCQRYEGITRRDQHKEASARVREAIEATRGQVLTYDGDICDTRFYKSCGGRTELFENVWAPIHYRYLESVECPYCNTQDRNVLSQVLNDYDLETQDFHHWTIRYTQAELSEIVRERSGIDFGDIQELRPIKRGPSYRIYELEIVGTKRSMVVGKELEIRKWLSRSHLYSSAFDIEFTAAPTPSEATFTLRGRGWGHGVGLCQIGAAVMADKGFTYEQILAHYFPNSHLEIKKM